MRTIDHKNQMIVTAGSSFDKLTTLKSKLLALNDIYLELSESIAVYLNEPELFKILAEMKCQGEASRTSVAKHPASHWRLVSKSLER